MKKDELGIIIFSRMSSSRLPGKALLPLEGVALIERIIIRAQSSGYKVYLATSNLPEDDVLEDFVSKLSVETFRGSLNHVLERAYFACKQFNIKAFARLCGDRPFFSISEMKNGLDYHLTHSDSTKISPDIITNYPFGHRIKGLTTEIILLNAIERILSKEITASNKEHLTSYIYENPSEFNILSFISKPPKLPINCYAVDTLDDLINLRKLVSEFPDICHDIVNY